ncbi:MAG TPA: transglutaminase domain-containing protein [Armatimonadota bacterium]|jgi:transglutaminase-like putative cysteine protease
MTRALRQPLLLLTLLLSASAGAFAETRDTWLGVYLMGNKLGHSHIVVEPARWQGKQALRITNDSRLTMSFLGQSTEQVIRSVDVTSPAYKPLSSEFSMSSMGRLTRVSARFEPSRIVAKVSSTGGASTKVIPIPKGVSLSVDPQLAMRGQMKVGTKVGFHYFNPATLVLEKATAEALRRDTVSHDGVAYPTLQVAVRTPMGDVTAWEDDSGDLVKMEAAFGIQMWRESRERATAGPTDKYAPPTDLAEITSVKVDKPIDDPRAMRYLKLRLQGLRSSNVVQDDRQKVTTETKDGVVTAELEVRTTDIPAAQAVSIQKAGSLEPRWVRASTQVQSDDAGMRTQAAKIVAGEKNALKAALKIRDWVHEHMTVRYDIALVRSSLDVLKDKVGVCRDYAILFAGLARAAGIPTRLAVGLVYAKGSFYYHAWDEVFVGKWIDLDPTAPTALVDATHLKFTHGDADAMFSSGRFAGIMTAQILEAR